MKKGMVFFLTAVLSFTMIFTPLLVMATDANGEKIEDINTKIVFDGHQYQIFDEPLTWHAAKERCKAMGGHLVTITTKEENDFIKDEVLKGGSLYYWLGATDEANEGTWNWVTGEPWSYTRWRSGQPDNSKNSEHYLMMYRHSDSFNSNLNGMWNDENVDCSEAVDLNRQGFICEWDGIESGNNPVLSKDDAKNFLAFLYNVNVNKLTEDFLARDQLYQLMIGNLNCDAKELNLKKLTALAFIDNAMNHYIKDSEAKMKVYNDKAIELMVDTWGDYIDDPLMGFDNPIADMILNVSKYVADGFVDIFAGLARDNLGVIVTEAKIQEILDVKKLAELPLKSAEDAQEFWERWIGSMKAARNAICGAFESEYYYRYTYFYSYLCNRIETSDENLFKATWKPWSQQIIMAAGDNFLGNVLVDIIGGTNGKTSWFKGADLIEHWAEYIYKLQNSIQPIVNLTSQLNLNKEQCEMYINEQLYLEVSDFQPKDITAQRIEWISSDESIAEVKNGVVKAKKSGMVTIIAKDAFSGVSANCNINVLHKSHVHSYSSKWCYDDENHFLICECGDRTGLSRHDYENWMVIIPASEDSIGVKKRICKVCNNTETEEISKILIDDNKNSLSYSSSRLTQSEYEYNGELIKPFFEITVSGKTLKKNRDYTVSYSNNKKIGTAKITVKGKGDYSGSKTITFKIVPKKVTISSAKSLTKKNIQVKWKKVSSAGGYQIRYSKSNKFSSPKTIKIESGAKTSCRISKLSRGKKYFVKVRAYKVVNGTTYYGKWSTVKTVRVK